MIYYGTTSIIEALTVLQREALALVLRLLALVAVISDPPRATPIFVALVRLRQAIQLVSSPATN